jgi:poly(3-hydroxybutyrate) depolymerase
MAKLLLFFPFVVAIRQVAAGITRHALEVSDPVLGPTTRRYALAVPASYAPSVRAPVLLYFHGQGDQWPPVGTAYAALGEQFGYLTVFPRGYGDFNGTDNAAYVAWNVGLVDAPMTLEGANATCFENTVPTCYDSCAGRCSRCAWSSCVDDVYFVESLLSSLGQNFTIDTGRVFATGASNGGMFVHHLAARRPNLIRAVAPVYGLPLVGMLRVPAAMGKISILQLHDRSDTTIPWQGGMTAAGWIYEALSTVLSSWARVHGCRSSPALTGLATPYDGGTHNFVCQEYRACRKGRVAQCFFDGHHGTWPTDGQIELLGTWFFFNYSLVA